MATSTKRPIQVNGILGYPNISEPDENGKYSALFLVKDPVVIAEIKALVKSEAALGFPELNGELPPGAHNPIRSAQERKADGRFAFKSEFINQEEGAIVIRAKSGFAPKTVSGEQQFPCDPADIEGGDEVSAVIRAYAYNNQSSGVAFSLDKVLLVNKGNGELQRGGSGGSFTFDVSKLNFRKPDMLSSDPDAAL